MTTIDKNVPNKAIELNINEIRPEKGLNDFDKLAEIKKTLISLLKRFGPNGTEDYSGNELAIGCGR